MDVDAQFPSLSAFVQPKRKRTLNQLGASGQPQKDHLWTLESSCWCVLTEQWKWRVGPHQTLKTLDAFIRRLPPTTPRVRIRDKICARESEFLDTVVEAAWALRFWGDGIQMALEVPLDPTQPKGNNADIVGTFNGIELWLDITSIKLDQSEFPVPSPQTPWARMRSDTEVVAKLAEKARAKYEDKFGAAVRSGLLKNKTLGILLCVVKSEAIVLPAFDFGLLPPPMAPEGLLDAHIPGLNLVWVHTLDASQEDDILRPSVLAKWTSS